MIAAVYARKSTQQEGAGATSESVERQIQHAQQFIIKKGWAIGPVYYDDAISGVTYAKLKDRARMVTDAAAGKFQALVVSEQSRLGRDWIESAYTIKKICESGVRIFAYLRDEEIEVTTDSGKMRIVFTGYASSQESTRTSERTRDGLRKRASAGYVTGGRLYGYKDSTTSTTSGRSSSASAWRSSAKAARRCDMPIPRNGCGRTAPISASFPPRFGSGWPTVAPRSPHHSLARRASARTGVGVAACSSGVQPGATTASTCLQGSASALSARGASASRTGSMARTPGTGDASTPAPPTRLAVRPSATTTR